MSYSFSMAFAPCDSFEQALVIGVQCADLLRKPENKKSLLRRNLMYIPSRRYTTHVTPFSDANWAHQLFTLRFVYWEDKKVLGLVMNDPQECGLDSFFHRSIYFQNSCDQDYDLNEWRGICRWFSDIATDHVGMTAQDLLKKGRWNDYTEEELNEDLDYHIRSDAYKEVFDELCLDDWLYGNSNPTFRQFSMAALQSMDDCLTAVRLAGGFADLAIV